MRIIHPDATHSNIVTCCYRVSAWLRDSQCFITDQIHEFTVTIPAHLQNRAIERLLYSVTHQRYLVRNKKPINKESSHGLRKQIG